MKRLLRILTEISIFVAIFRYACTRKGRKNKHWEHG